MTAPSRGRGPRRTVLRDLLVVGAITVGAYIAATRLDLADGLHSWLSSRSNEAVGEIVIVLVVLVLGLAVFSALRVQERRRESSERTILESRYRELVERVPAITYVWDTAGVVGEDPAEFISPQIERLLGYTVEEWQSDPGLWRDRVHPEDLEGVLAAWREAMETGAAFRAEYRLLAKDGRVVWVSDEAQRGEGAHGAQTVLQGVIFDITERKVVEQQVRQAEERYRTLVERMPAVVYVEEPDDVSTALYVSPEYERLFGYTREERQSDPELWTKLLHPDDRERVIEQSRRTNETGEPFRSEYRMIAKDGRIVWVRDEASLVGSEEGGPRLWQGVLIDITEQRVAQGLLEEAEARFRTLVEQLPAVTYISSLEAETPIYISPQYERMLGYSPEERISDPGLWRRLLHPDDRDAAIAESERASRSGEDFSMEYRMIARDGRVVWISEQAALLRDERGKPQFWQGILLDITERRQAEEQIAEAQERYRTLVEQLPVVTYIDGLEGDATIYISPQIEAMLGWTPEEWIGEPRRWERSLHPDDREWVMEADNASTASGEQLRIEHRFIAKDGRVVWVRDQSTLVRDEHGKPRFWQGIYVDITEEKRSEELVREAEARYRTLVETAPAVTYIDTVDEPWEIIYVSPQLEEILGYSPDEWRGTDAWERATHPDDLPDVRAAARANRDAGEPYDIEYRVRANDGRLVWVRDQGRVVRDEEGAPLFFQGMMFDITEARSAAEQLREAEERFRVLVEHSPAMLYVETGDPNAASLYVGPQVEQLFGVTPEEYLDDMDRWEQLVHPEDREWAVAAYRSRLASKEPWNLEYRVVRPDGREVWVRDESTVLLDDDGDIRLVQGVIYDITERKIAEQAAQERERREREAADRLRALDDMKNTFLAAVSHELRSPLTSILGLSLTLERQDKLSDDDREDLLSRLAGNARKLDRLLKDLLDIDRLSRGIVEPQYRQTDLGALVRRTIESLDTMGGRDIRVQTEPLVIPVDPAKVERIVENLVANAIRHTEADRTVWVGVRIHEGGALLSIEDDGPGVPDDLKQAIFEPFRQGPVSATARANPGTGIGLSLVGRFAELHGGRAWVGDRQGGGASFNVFLPGTPPTQAAAGAGDVDRPDAEVLHPFGTADAG